MENEWPIATLDELKATSANAIAMGPFGSRIRTENFVPYGVPVIRGNNLSSERFHDDDFVYLTEQKADELRSANAFKLDIVVTHRGTLGQVGIIPPWAKYNRYVVSQSQMKLTVDRKRADPFFIFYFLRSPEGQHQLLSNSSQTGVPAIASPTKALKSIRIPCPSLPEQRAIARILGSLDDKIEANRRMNETLEAMARAIFKSWFVDFDPVRAKAAGREPAGMDAETAALFPDSFEETELGMVPRGWRVGVVEELCISIENGGTPKRMEPEYWLNGTIPWFKTGELTDGPLIESEEAITEIGLANSSCKLWNIGTILIALYASPTVGRLGILEMPATANQACSALIAKPEYGNLFLFHSLLFAREELQNIAVGAAQQNISQQVVRHHILLIPDPGIASAFQQRVETYYSMRVNNEKQSRILAAIRDELLPKLMSGEIRTEVRS